MANVTPTTGIDNFNGTLGTTAGADEIRVTAQNQINSGDLYDGGAGTDTLRLYTSLDFTSIITGATSGIKNIEIIRFNTALTGTFRSDQFGTGLIASNVTLTGAAGVQNIVINMIAGGSTFEMTAWQFSGWTGGTDLITVNGSSGNDTIKVSSQHTIFDGGAGSDTLDYSNWAGGFTLTLNGSTQARATWTSSVYDLVSNVENVVGSTDADTITGDNLANALSGAAGNDTLDGAGGDDILDGGLGADRMVGGVGSDTFYVDDALDVVIERATDAGTDLVYSSVSFSAAGIEQDGIENITLTGTAAINATGNDLNNILTGNTADNILDGGAGNDQLFGNAGADTLNGGAGNDTLDGGAGADTMTGGADSDVYIVDDAGDVVVELSTDSGTDLVQSSVTFSAAGANQSGIENITLTGTGNINATGNALANTLTGNSGNNVLDGGTGADTMTGGVGNDTYVVDNAGDVVVELSSDSGTDLVQSSVTFSAAGTNQSGIENITLTGTGNINATGNALANTLTGNSGNNVLDGGTGADTMTGGAGNDTYVVDNAGDVVVELSTDSGTDLVQSSVTFSAAGTNQSGIESITLIGLGNINATGNALANALTGNSGNNVLDGGTGADTMTGGAGNDTYVVDNAGDVVVELSTDTGTDLVQSSVTFSAAGTNQSGIENITLIGTGNINATGNALANTLTGNAGNNVLDGGAGADTMTGGAGNDTYVVDDAGDVVVELSTDTGTDLVQSSVTFSAAGTNQSGIENITLTGTANINATGNALANTLTGNSGNNVLDGGAGDDVLDGGSGADTLIGSTGNDTFYVDNAGDIVIDRASDVGTDLVLSSVTFSASGTDQDGIENITLTGTGNINATGNALANTLIGNSGNNVLDGGTGADTMAGGAGSDIYYVDNLSDVVTERAFDAGTDLIYSSVTFSAAGTNQDGIENISLTGATNINATGNALANIIIGNSGNNVLVGGGGNDTLTGGLGNDTLTGGTGADVFTLDVINTLGTQADTITDFSIADGDQISLQTSGPGSFETLARWMIRSNSSGSAFISGGWNNNGQTLTLTGVSAASLTASQFIFDTSGTARNLTGTVNADMLVGALGNDTLTAGDGNDFLLGDGGSDILIGGNGNDVLDGGTGGDTMTGGAGNDIYYVDDAGDVVNELVADGGVDQVDAWITYALTGTAAGVEKAYLRGIADINLTGNDLNNSLYGNSGNNQISGGDGNDQIFAGDGADVLDGGAGNDNLNGDGGNDILLGGQGNDVLNGGLGADQMTGGAGNDTYSVDNLSDVVFESVSDGGTDTVKTWISFSLTGTAAGVENGALQGTANIDVTGNGLNNALTGNAGDNRIDGGDGADTLKGGAGNDVVIGGNGNDALYGDEGADLLIGGAGNDKLYGGNGADIFQFARGSGADTIYDFTVSADKLDLTAYGIESAAELLPYASNSGANLRINFGSGDIITLQNVQLAQVHDGMFVV